jgi:hypothetical protein
MYVWQLTRLPRYTGIPSNTDFDFVLNALLLDKIAGI